MRRPRSVSYILLELNGVRLIEVGETHMAYITIPAAIAPTFCADAMTMYPADGEFRDPSSNNEYSPMT